MATGRFVAAALLHRGGWGKVKGLGRRQGETDDVTRPARIPRGTCYYWNMTAKIVGLPDELHQQIVEFARRTGRAESGLLHEAIAIYPQARHVPRPRSDGTIDDPEFAARDGDDVLAANWRPV